ncbi:MAG: hypothetical protein NC320_02940 [Clostridium sp.]|nr:hypothetical protein [Clostridium sp.]MCM1546988.1 hypothetical protein [Ruminococcus sp.]
MAEFVSSATQTVAAGQNVVFTETAVKSCNCNIMHREGSGIVTLRGSNNCCKPARYKVTFGGNIAVAAGGTAGAISVAIALSGEPIYSAAATVTPAAVGEFNNIFAAAVISVPCNCCLTVAVENTSGTP